MGRSLKRLMIVLLIGLWAARSAAEDIPAKAIAPTEINKDQITREKIHALDEQVQDIKSDVLDISSKLIEFEDKFIYPSDTRIAIFLAVAQGDKFRFDAVKIRIDGKEAANHIYTPGELDALQRGGVKRIYTGNIQSGEHALEVAISGKSASNNDYQLNANYKFTKDAGTKLIEISLTGSGSQGIGFRD